MCSIQRVHAELVSVHIFFAKRTLWLLVEPPGNALLVEIIVAARQRELASSVAREC